MRSTVQVTLDAVRRLSPCFPPSGRSAGCRADPAELNRLPGYVIGLNSPRRRDTSSSPALVLAGRRQHVHGLVVLGVFCYFAGSVSACQLEARQGRSWPDETSWRKAPGPAVTISCRARILADSAASVSVAGMTTRS